MKQALVAHTGLWKNPFESKMWLCSLKVVEPHHEKCFELEITTISLEFKRLAITVDVGVSYVRRKMADMRQWSGSWST